MHKRVLLGYSTDVRSERDERQLERKVLPTQLVMQLIVCSVYH